MPIAKQKCLFLVVLTMGVFGRFVFKQWGKFKNLDHSTTVFHTLIKLPNKPLKKPYLLIRFS